MPLHGARGNKKNHKILRKYKDQFLRSKIDYFLALWHDCIGRAFVGPCPIGSRASIETGWMPSFRQTGSNDRPRVGIGQLSSLTQLSPSKNGPTQPAAASLN